jgi:hypothetical protein
VREVEARQDAVCSNPLASAASASASTPLAVLGMRVVSHQMNLNRHRSVGDDALILHGLMIAAEARDPTGRIDRVPVLEDRLFVVFL